MSKRKWNLFLLLFLFPLWNLSFAKTPQKKVFEAKILDTSNVEHHIQNVHIQSKGFSFFGGGDEKGKGELSFYYGKATVVIPFEEIEKIEAKGRDKQTTQIVVVLKSGKKLEGTIRSNVELQGKTSYASSYSLKFLYLKSLIFTSYSEKMCSKCKRHFVNKGWKFCPFDGTKLTP